MQVWDTAPTQPAESGSPIGAIKGPDAMGREEMLLRALVLGVRDYAGKCGFKRPCSASAVASIQPWWP